MIAIADLPRRTCACVDVEMGSYAATIELVPPRGLTRSDRRGICVDVCLALEVSRLWSAGVLTTGCCCGHGRIEPTIGVHPMSVGTMRSLGYRRSPLAAPGRDDVFTARTGWPIGAAA